MTAFKSKSFRALKKHWDQKLVKSGFPDIEDRWGLLKYKYSDRAHAVTAEDRELIHNFYRALDHYITEHPELPVLHKTILTLYSDGKKVKDICRKTKRCKSNVLEIIKRYRNLILGFN